MKLRDIVEHAGDWLDELGVPRWVAPHVPLAAALRDHLASGHPVEVVAERGEGFEYVIDTSEFFSLEASTATLDARALDEARGRVLDIGAGAGRHALALQSRGLSVRAVDVSAVCVDVMRQRGVRDARRANAFALVDGEFDTILLLMQSIGVAGNRRGVERLLERLRRRLAPGGQILLDSSALPADAGVRPGAGVKVRFRYRNLHGRWFSWIYLGEDELASIAAGLGWRCEVLAREPDGVEYLARLTR